MNNSSTTLRVQNRRAVCIFGAVDQTAFLQFVATHRPENREKFPKGGQTPFGTPLLERSGKSVVYRTTHGLEQRPLIIRWKEIDVRP